VTPADQLEAIEEAVEGGDYEPTPWEEEFLENMAELLEEDEELSEAQTDSLEEIWQKATGEE
jgi:hypothetical protein